MNAEKFYGCADGPGALITHDSDGKPLVGEELIGWECWGCGNLYVDRNDAEQCCIEPDVVIGIAKPAT
jgi:hypothetical protein